MERTSKVADDQPRLGAGLLLGIALVYLLAEVLSSAAALGATNEISVTLATVAQALPALVGATVIAGAAAGLWLPTRSSLADRRRPLAGAVAGAAIGLVVGGGILLTFGASGGVGVLAGTLLVAAVLGGLAAALPPPVLAAGLAGIVGCLLVAILISIFQNPLATVLGGGTGASNRFNGAILLGIVESVIQGIVAAVVATRYLRARDGGRAWPWYLLAGAAYGIAGLATLAISRIGGLGLYRQVSGFSADDAAYLNLLLQSSLRGALVAGFVGGIGAVIVVGRSMSRTASS
jgi:hypothetical protein